MHSKKMLALAVLIACASAAAAAGDHYQLDPTHTYPGFEADHEGGASI